MDTLQKLTEKRQADHSTFEKFLTRADVEVSFFSDLTFADKTIMDHYYFKAARFVWCTQGAVQLDFDDREKLIFKEGEFILFFSQRRATVTGLSSKNVLFGGRVLGLDQEEFLNSLGFYDCLKGSCIYPAATFQQLHAMTQQMNHADARARASLLTSTHNILASVLDELRPVARPLFFDAVRLLNQNFYAGIVRLAPVCKQLQISRGHLNNIFSAQAMPSPSRYIKDLQLRRATQLMHASHLSLAQIAEACAFTSLSHFSSFIRTRTGQSPRAWRDRHVHTHP